MATIANGVFKQLIVAKEQTNSIGTLVNTLGEGLTSPATIAVPSTIASGAALTAANLTVTGNLLVGQVFTISDDTYKITTATSSAGGNTTVFTTLPATASRAYTAKAPVKMYQSTDITPISTSGGLTVTPTTNTGVTVTSGDAGAVCLAATVLNPGVNASAGVSTLTLGGTGITTGGIVLGNGQRFQLGVGSTIYTVTGSTQGTGAFATTATITITPPTAAATAASDVFVFRKSENAKFLRRVTSNLDLKKATFKSNEIRTDMQRAILAVGANSVDGTISGELSNRTYADFMAAVTRKNFATSNDMTLTGTVNAAINPSISNTQLTLTGIATNTALVDLVSGIKVGDIVRTANVATLAGLTISVNGITAGILPVGTNMIVTSISTGTVTLELLNAVFTSPIAVSGTDTGLVSFQLQGKKTFIPKTNHNKDSFQIEHFYKDLGQSELFVGCRPTQMALKLSPSAMSTVDFTFMGQNMTATATTGPVLSAAPQPSFNDAVVSANTGALYMKDQASGVLSKIGLVTAFDTSVNGNGSVAQVVGSQYTPDVFLGALDVTGNMSIYFTDAVYRDSFLNQSDVSIIAVFRADSLSDGEFISIVIPKARLTTASKDDGEKGLILTTPYSALVYDQSIGGTLFEETTIQIQDSAL